MYEERRSVLGLALSISEMFRRWVSKYCMNPWSSTLEGHFHMRSRLRRDIPIGKEAMVSIRAS